MIFKFKNIKIRIKKFLNISNIGNKTTTNNYNIGYASKYNYVIEIYSDNNKVVSFDCNLTLPTTQYNYYTIYRNSETKKIEPFLFIQGLSVEILNGNNKIASFTPQGIQYGTGTDVFYITP